MSTASLDAFELAVSRRQWDAALDEALKLLKAVDARHGRLDGIAASAAAEQRATRIATRFAAAFGQIVADPAVPIPPLAYEQLTVLRRWTELMFLASGFGSSDYLAPMLAVGEPGARRVPPELLARFMLIFSPAAGMTMNLDECLAIDPAATVMTLLGQLATRFCFSEGAHAFREALLDWLPSRLSQVKLGELALQWIASPYMHCSYAANPRKHAVKGPLIAQMRRALLEAGCPELHGAGARPTGRPTVVVTAENLSEGHSVHRTHFRALAALRSRFRVVGVAYPQHLSPAVEAAFDDIIPIAPGEGFLGAARVLAGQVLARRPALVLHLGVGMSPHVIALAALRLAPVQAASFGHTATTGSPVIDYMVLPEDFVGDPACFGERLLALPAAAMPYLARRDVDYAAARARGEAVRRERGDGRVRIAVPASAMKLGPPLFDALARAAEAATAAVAFEFFPLGAAGLGHLELQRRLAVRLPTAEVHEELPYDRYIERLAACDFFVCPFPYGNMNSIVDAVLVGLPGVCLDGAEAHAHADAAYFRRLGLPEALIATTTEAYVAAVARLASDPSWLTQAREAAAGADLEAAFFAGDADLFAEAMLQLASAAPAGPGPAFA